jgi:surface antigen
MPAPLPKLAVVLTATALLLASGAARATVEVQRAQRAPVAATAPAPTAESGGNRVTSTASTCPLTTLVVASSFGQAGVVPLADGLTTTCSLAQRPDFLGRASAAFERAINMNKVITWNWVRAGAFGRVVPGRSFADSGGRTCREFNHLIAVGGRLETSAGLVCRGSQGSWHLIR